MADGVEVPVEEMDTTHLANLLRFLQRNIDMLRIPTSEPEKSNHDWLIENHSHYSKFVDVLGKRDVDYLVTGADLRVELEPFTDLEMKVPQFECLFRFEQPHPSVGDNPNVRARILVPQDITVTQVTEALIQIHPMQYKDHAKKGELFHINVEHSHDYTANAIAQGRILEVYA